jgi:hypothetical protein
MYIYLKERWWRMSIVTDKLTVDKHWLQDGSLFIEVSSDDREALTNNVRKFAQQYVAGEPELSSWANAGVEKASTPVAYDPDDKESDPYTVARQCVKTGEEQPKWRYRQLVKLTRSLFA